MLTKKYQSQPTGIVTYNYTDISDGTGVVVLNAFEYALSGSTLYGLSSQTPYSYEIEKNIAAGSIPDTNYGSILDLDFDLSAFNTPKTIRGKAAVSIPVKITNTEDKSYGCYIIAKIRKWDGTTETEIASAISPNVVTSNYLSEATVLTIPLTIPETFFKQSEILRLTINFWGYKQSGATGTMQMGIDPMNRDGDNIVKATDLIPTKLEFHCPFELDL